MIHSLYGLEHRDRYGDIRVRRRRLPFYQQTIAQTIPPTYDPTNR